eukprot:5190566-Ditylum_brightwellii.AAC.1
MENDMQAVGGLTDTARESSVCSTSSPHSNVYATNGSVLIYSDNSSSEGPSAYSNASKGSSENYEEESSNGSAKSKKMEESSSSSNWPLPMDYIKMSCLVTHQNSQQEDNISNHNMLEDQHICNKFQNKIE